MIPLQSGQNILVKLGRNTLHVSAKFREITCRSNWHTFADFAKWNIRMTLRGRTGLFVYYVSADTEGCTRRIDFADFAACVASDGRFGQMSYTDFRRNATNAQYDIRSVHIECVEISNKLNRVFGLHRISFTEHAEQKVWELV